MCFDINVSQYLSEEAQESQNPLPDPRKAKPPSVCIDEVSEAIYTHHPDNIHHIIFPLFPFC